MMLDKTKTAEIGLRHLGNTLLSLIMSTWRAAGIHFMNTIMGVAVHAQVIESLGVMGWGWYQMLGAAEYLVPRGVGFYVLNSEADFPYKLRLN